MLSCVYSMRKDFLNTLYKLMFPPQNEIKRHHNMDVLYLKTINSQFLSEGYSKILSARTGALTAYFH